MTALLAALAMIAGSLLLDKTQTWIINKKNKKNKVTSDDVISAVNKLTSEARAKGSEVLSKLSDKLNSITMPFGVSSAVKDYITRIRNKISSDFISAREDISNVETKLTQAENRANNLSAQSEDYRAQFGKQNLNDIIHDAKAGYDKIKDIEQKLGGQDA